jgi:hypothetical protein
MSDLDLPPSDLARQSTDDESFDDETFIDGIRRPALTDADFRGCRWIEGEPSPLRSGMFCGSPVQPGKAWCAMHHGVVFEKVFRRRGREYDDIIAFRP